MLHPAGNDACNDGVCSGAFKPAGRLCRASVGPCGVAESCNGASNACPTGATTFAFQGPLDPASSSQAKAACEACYRVHACYRVGACTLENAGCVGPG